jgi:hypothetical protein
MFKLITTYLLFKYTTGNFENHYNFPDINLRSLISKQALDGTAF